MHSHLYLFIFTVFLTLTLVASEPGGICNFFLSCAGIRKPKLKSVRSFTPLLTGGREALSIEPSLIPIGRFFTVGDLQERIGEPSEHHIITWPAQVADIFNYEFINTAAEIAKIKNEQGPHNVKKRVSSQDLEDGVQYMLSNTIQRDGDIVFMSISEEDRWSPEESMTKLDHIYYWVTGKYWNAASSPNKSAAEVVERLLLQMEYLLAKNYRVFVATIPPYETLPASDYEDVFSKHLTWVLEVNQELENRIEARNRELQSSLPHVCVIDVYRFSGLDHEELAFYDDMNFSTLWHQSITPHAVKQIAPMLRDATEAL